MADTVIEAGITPTRARMKALLTRLHSRPVETPSEGEGTPHSEVLHGTAPDAAWPPPGAPVDRARWAGLH